MQRLHGHCPEKPDLLHSSESSKGLGRKEKRKKFSLDKVEHIRICAIHKGGITDNASLSQNLVCRRPMVSDAAFRSDLERFAPRFWSVRVIEQSDGATRQTINGILSSSVNKLHPHPL